MKLRNETHASRAIFLEAQIFAWRRRKTKDLPCLLLRWRKEAVREKRSLIREQKSLYDLAVRRGVSPNEAVKWFVPVQNEQHPEVKITAEGEAVEIYLKLDYIARSRYINTLPKALILTGIIPNKEGEVRKM